MSFFADMKNNIPLVDFNTVIEKALHIYTTTPKSVWREFSLVDEMISNHVINEQFDYSTYVPLIDLSPNEFLTIRSKDIKNLFIIDVETCSEFSCIVLQCSQNTHGNTLRCKRCDDHECAHFPF